jgi:dTDP-4-dehydrorhamnose reductase
VVLNASAYTAVDKAETETALADRINAEAVGEIGEAARRAGARVLHFSTDYVFAGDAAQPYRESDTPAPASAYGRSKRAGEQALVASGAEYLLLRVAWVYAPHGHNFLRTMLRLGAERDVLRVVADQIGAPTPAHWIAGVALRALDADARGLFHLAPQGEASWHAFAEAIFAGAVQRGLLPHAPRVDAITTADYPTPARRPAWSVLDSSALAKAAGIRLPHWAQGVDEVLDRLAGARG